MKSNRTQLLRVQKLLNQSMVNISLKDSTILKNVVIDILKE